LVLATVFDALTWRWKPEELEGFTKRATPSSRVIFVMNRVINAAVADQNAVILAAESHNDTPRIRPGPSNTNLVCTVSNPGSRAQTQKRLHHISTDEM